MESQVSPLSLVQAGIECALNLEGVGVWEQNSGADQVICSDGFYQLMGVEPETGRVQDGFWRSRVHPEDKAHHDVAYFDFLHGLVPAYEEIYRLRHERGYYITVLARARWESPGGSEASHRVLGYVIDVTARSADFDRLRVHEERFRMSLSALHGVVYDLDLRTNRTERHGVRRMLGHETLEAEDGYGGWLSIIHPDDQARVVEHVNASRRNATNFEMSYRVRHMDGRWRHVRQRGSYMLGHDGAAIRAFGVIEDVTDTEAQYEQLQMQAAIIERMSEGVLLLARDGTILFANPALEKMFGYARGELQGRASHDLSFRSKANFDGLVSAVFDGTENDRTSIIDLEGRRRDNSMHPLQGCFSSLTLGSSRCVLAVVTDIAERKQLERELMQVATRVQQRIGSDLHDGLGQQLAGIAMMLQGLGQRAGQAGAPELRKEVEEVVTLVNAAIGSTRSLARGLSPVRPSREGLVEGFEELVNQVHERYRIRVQLELVLPLELRLDENAATNLYRIAQEGVLNAARHADAENIQLRFKVQGADVELLVIDDGKGFDPLQFANRGMGLRIMRFRAQLVGGYLSLESRPGAGTALRCRCPLNASKEVA